MAYTDYFLMPQKDLCQMLQGVISWLNSDKYLKVW